MTVRAKYEFEIPQPMRADKFLNELGILMYDTKWKNACIRHLVEEDTEGDLEGRVQAHTLYRNLIEVIERNRGFAQVRLDNFLLSRLYPLDPGPGFYSIDKAYWLKHFDADQIDWKLSTLSIPGRYIIVREGYKRPKEDEIVTAPWYIHNYESLLGEVFEKPPLPTADLVARYRDVQRNVWLELIAFTWRVLAIEKPEDSRGLQTSLIDRLRHYMSRHHLDDDGNAELPDSTIHAFVSNILEQWRAREMFASVLLNSKANSVPRKSTKVQTPP